MCKNHFMICSMVNILKYKSMSQDNDFLEEIDTLGEYLGKVIRYGALGGFGLFFLWLVYNGYLS